MPKHLLILCHDLINAQLDRRITQQAAVWIERGWDVTLIGMTEKAGSMVERWSSGVVVVKIDQNSMPKVEDKFWEQLFTSPVVTLSKRDITSDEVTDFVDGLSTAQSHATAAAPAIRQRLASIPFIVARKAWSLFPPRAKARSASHIWSVARRVWRLLPRRAKNLLTEKASVQALASSVLGEWYPLPCTQALLDAARDLPADVILSADLATLPAGVELADRFGALVLYDAHELYPEQVTFSQRQKALLKYHERRSLQRVFIAYTVSDAFADLMQKAYDLTVRPRVLTNAPDFTPHLHNPAQVGPLRRALGLDASTRIILYHGGFSPHRNIEILIRGFTAAALPNVRLVFLGYGDRNLVERTIAEGGSEDRITILNAVPAAELDRWVGDADHVVIPYPAVDLNTTWCSPNKLYDCIALGVPLIVNRDLRNVSEVIAKFRIGISLDMSTPERLAEDFRNAFSIPLPPADFTAAREKLGWDAQRRVIESWIDEIEAHLASDGCRRVG